MNEQEKLYKTDKHGYTTIKVKFNPMLLSILGYYNPLKLEDRPNLEQVEELKAFLARTYNIYL